MRDYNRHIQGLITTNALMHYSCTINGGRFGYNLDRVNYLKLILSGNNRIELNASDAAKPLHNVCRLIEYVSVRTWPGSKRNVQSAVQQSAEVDAAGRM